MNSCYYLLTTWGSTCSESTCSESESRSESSGKLNQTVKVHVPITVFPRVSKIIVTVRLKLTPNIQALLKLCC